jgi:hypothetical protein
MVIKWILIIVLIAFVGTLQSQSLEDKLTYFDGNNAKGFLQPLANTVGAGLNSGFYNTAQVLPPFLPLFKMGMVLISVPSEDKTFIARSPHGDIWGDVETATVFGGRGQSFPGISPAPNSPYRLPNGADLNIVVIPCFSVSLGLPKGSEVMVRFLPERELSSDLGNIGFWGVGLKHSLDQYLTKFFPVHLAVQGVYQDMKVTDAIQINTFAVNAHASKNIPFLPLTVYGGIGWERANIEVKYDYRERDSDYVPGETDSQSRGINLSFESDNDMKVTLGARYALLPFVRIFADYSIANTSSWNMGLGIGF